MATATFRIWRGDAQGGSFADYATEVAPGMVVLDAVHRIQAEQAPDLAVRWNCKAGKCGSCSAEVNGLPRLMCMTRLSDLPLSEPVTLRLTSSVPTKVSVPSTLTIPAGSDRAMFGLTIMDDGVLDGTMASSPLSAQFATTKPAAHPAIPSSRLSDKSC